VARATVLCPLIERKEDEKHLSIVAVDRIKKELAERADNDFGEKSPPET